MRLPCRAEGLFDAKVQLDTATAEPDAAAPLPRQRLVFLRGVAGGVPKESGFSAGFYQVIALDDGCDFLALYG